MENGIECAHLAPMQRVIAEDAAARAVCLYYGRIGTCFVSAERGAGESARRGACLEALRIATCEVPQMPSGVARDSIGRTSHPIRYGQAEARDCPLCICV